MILYYMGVYLSKRMLTRKVHFYPTFF